MDGKGHLNATVHPVMWLDVLLIGHEWLPPKPTEPITPRTCLLLIRLLILVNADFFWDTKPPNQTVLSMPLKSSIQLTTWTPLFQPWWLTHRHLVPTGSPNPHVAKAPP